MNTVSNPAFDLKSFYKTVFSLVFPMALQNLINVAVTSADVIMLGRVGETVLSASSLAGQVLYILTLVFYGLTSGAMILTAQYWGKRDVRTIEKLMGISMRIALTASLIFMFAALLFPGLIMRIFTNDEAVIAEGIKYLRIVALSYPFIAVTMVYLNIMRSVERVVVSTVVYSISLLINIALNGVLIFGLLGFPALGIQGAAIATVIARVAEVGMVFIYDKKFNRVVKVRLSDLFLREKLLFRDYLTYTVPVTMNEILWGLAMSMNSVIIGHLGSSVVAANSVAQVTRQLATVVAFGIANAAAVMIGKAIGENNFECARLFARHMIYLSLVFGAIGSVVVLIVRPIAIASLNLTPLAQEYLSAMMYVMCYFVFLQSYNTTLIVGVFRAGGDAKFGLFVDIATMWGGSVLLGSLCAFVLKWSIPAVYVVLLCDEILRTPLTTWRYRGLSWLRNVTR